MLSSMAKVYVVGSRSALDRAVQTLHRLGAVQIEDVGDDLRRTAGQFERIGPDAEEKAELEGILTRVNATLKLLAVGSRAIAQPEPPSALDVQDPRIAAEALLTRIEPECARLAARRAELDAEASSLRQYRGIVAKLTPLVEGMVDLEGFETTALLVQRRYRFALDLIRTELAKITHDQYDVISADVDEESAAAIVVYNRRHSAAVRALLQGENLNEVRLPREYSNLPFREVLESIKARESAIPAQQAEVSRRLAELSDEWLGALQGLRAALWNRLEELAVLDRLAATKHVFVLSGWVPRKRLDEVRAALAAVSDELEVTEVELSAEEERRAPVLLDNVRAVQPFELLMGVLTPPRYGTIDPTPFLAVFFPLFFGLILGDVAYGLVLLAISAWILRRERRSRLLDQVGRIMLICSLSAIVFGVAYGEFLGDLGEQFGMHPLIVDRMEAIIPVLVFSVGLGAVHVTLGLVLGIANAYLEHRRKEMLDRAAMILALAAVFTLVGVVADVLPDDLLQPGIAALVVALVLLIYTVGIAGPLEVFSAIGNVLSYSRLMAIGLSSVVLAKVANELAGVVGNLLLGVIVAALFHGLNIALGAFSPSIQSARLHYVEFFGKFYQSGGRPFKPFAMSELPELAPAAEAPARPTGQVRVSNPARGV